MNKLKKIIILTALTVMGISSIASATVWNKKYFTRNLPTDINLTNSCVSWENLPVASTTSILSPTNISTATLVASGTSYTLAAGDYTDIIFPRNITVDMYFSVGESTTIVTGSCVVTGNNQFGRSTTETLSVSTNAVTSVNAFSTITNIAFSDVAIADASVSTTSVSVGSSVKIALPNNIQGTGDMIKVIEAGATSTSYTANATYDTIQFASAPDGTKDYYIYFMNRTNKLRYKYSRD